MMRPDANGDMSRCTPGVHHTDVGTRHGTHGDVCGRRAGEGAWARQGSSYDESVADLESPEVEWARRLLAGDAGAFTPFVESFQSKVFQYTWLMCAQREDAEEVAQDTLLKVFESFDQLRDPRLVKAWVFRIAVRKSWPPSLTISGLCSSRSRRRFSIMTRRARGAMRSGLRPSRT